MKNSQSKPAGASHMLYGEDLAQIHIDGYDVHWRSAAPSILEWLRDSGIRHGLVVDLGCGGGQWLAHLANRGYDTCGIDISAAMIGRARVNAPAANLVQSSFAHAAIPDCHAVTSLGEPLNYLNSGALVRQTLANVFQSLRPNGLFVFDARHPANCKLEPVHHHKSGDDWFCYARIEESNDRLVRHITTFCRKGVEQFRRSQEVHRLKLFSADRMARWLCDTGFQIRTAQSYGNYRLAPRQLVLICRKPDKRAVDQ